MDRADTIAAFSWRGFAGAGDTPLLRAQRIRVTLACLLAFVTSIGLLAAGAQFLNDPDTLWHVAVGGDIWTSKSFPHVDAYSHTFAGEPWIAKEWLSQIILYAAYATGGWNGVVALSVIIAVAVVAQIYWTLSGLIKPTFAAAATACVLMLCSTVFLARPHLIVMPVMLAFVFALLRAAHRGEAPPFILLIAMCLWSNLHGSFTFGYVAAAFSFLIFFAEHRNVRSPLTYRWIAFLALCPLVSMINPYGFEAIWSTIVIVKSEALPYIQEWRPFSAADHPLWEAALLIMIAMLAAGRLRVGVVAIGFICLLAHMFLTHVRFIYLFATITPALLAYAAAKQFPAASFEGWAQRAGEDELERNISAVAPIAAALFALATIASVGAAAATQRWAPGDTYPIAAIRAAQAWGATGNVINYYPFGGALIYERIPTFIDGRADRLFQNGFMDAIAQSRLAGGEDVLQRQIAQYDIGWSLYPPNDKRVILMDKLPGWTRIYADDIAVVHAREKSGE